MRELECSNTDPTLAAVPSLAVIGRGRLGSALARGARRRRRRGRRPAGRAARTPPATAPCCCASPISEIAAAAALIAPGPLVGHCSGATGLEPLAAHEAFSLHPLMTVTADSAAAVRRRRRRRSPAAPPPRSRSLARWRPALGMEPFEVRDRGPGRLPRRGVDRVELPGHARGGGRAARAAAPASAARALVPLVRATVENWAALGRATGADRAGRAGRRRNRSPRSATRSPSARRSCWRCSTRWSMRPGARAVVQEAA